MSSSIFSGLNVNISWKFCDQLMALNENLSSGSYTAKIIACTLHKTVARTTHLFAYPVGAPAFNIYSILSFVWLKRTVRFPCRVHPKSHCRPLFIDSKIVTLKLFISKFDILWQKIFTTTHHLNYLKVPVSLLHLREILPWNCSEINFRIFY